MNRAGGAFVRFAGAFLVGLWVPVEYIVLGAALFVCARFYTKWRIS